MSINGCNSSRDKDLHTHLLEVSKINANVPLNNWEILVGYQGELEHRYELERSESDTFSFVNFSYLPKLEVYDLSGYVITYFVDSVYNELSIINDDTLYHLYAVTDYILLKTRPPKRIEKHFIKGKEYYVKERRIPLKSMDDPVY